MLTSLLPSSARPVVHCPARRVRPFAALLSALRLMLIAALMAHGVDAAGQDAAAPAGNRENVAWIALPLDERHIIKQGTLTHGLNACAPSTILNLLLNGPPEFRQVFAHLPGTSDQEKFDSIIQLYGQAPSRTWERGTSFKEAGGQAPLDTRDMTNAILAREHIAELDFRQLAGRSGESGPHLLARVHRLLTASLGAGVPVAVSVLLDAAVGENGTIATPGQWSGMVAHAILVVAVAEELRKFQKGFGFRYIDPATGDLEEAFLHCDTVNDPPRHPLYLQVDAPGIDLATPPIPQNAGRYLGLTTALGRFPKIPLLWTWSPNDVSEAWKTVDVPLPPALVSSGRMRFEFQYSAGQHRLDIQWLALLVDGREFAREAHPGTTGAYDDGNQYTLPIPTAPAGSTLALRACVRSDGGNDSFGDLFIVAPNE